MSTVRPEVRVTFMERSEGGTMSAVRPEGETMSISRPEGGMMSMARPKGGTTVRPCQGQKGELWLGLKGGWPAEEAMSMVRQDRGAM